MKTQKRKTFYFIFMLIFSINIFAQTEIDESDTNLKIGSTGLLDYNPSLFSETDKARCLNNGVLITTSGSQNTTFVVPSNGNNFCNPNPAPSIFTTQTPHWTGTSSNGFVKYTFSQPVTNVRISYGSVNNNDVGTISINSPGMQLSNPCGLTINGSVVSSSINSGWGNVALTVSSNVAFTTITLVNTGGKTGWVTGNPCNFIITSNIITTPKAAFYFCAGSAYFSIDTIFVGATINGIPANASNSTIVPMIPVPPYDPTMAINIEPILPKPDFINISPGGGVSVNPNAPANFNVEFYVQICSGGTCSIPMRINVFTCANKINTDVIIKPNPSSDGIYNLSFNQEIKKGMIEVYNFMGEKVYEENFLNKFDFQININKFPKGTYILKIFNEYENIIKKIIKE